MTFDSGQNEVFFRKLKLGFWTYDLMRLLDSNSRKLVSRHEILNVIVLGSSTRFIWSSIKFWIKHTLFSKFSQVMSVYSQKKESLVEQVSDSFKKKNLRQKSFSDNLEWSSKNLWKIISADVRKKRTNGCISFNFYRKYLQNLKYSVDRACIFYLILLGIPSRLVLPVKNRGVQTF